MNYGSETSAESGEALVALREVTADNLLEVLELQVAEPQRAFVPSNAWSIAQASFHPEAWFRAIYAADRAVGFVMLRDESLLPKPRQSGCYFLWRLMIDASHQRRGYGRRAVGLLVEHVRNRPHARELLTAYVRGPGSPEDFYRSLGFLPTGRELEEGEVELRLPL